MKLQEQRLTQGKQEDCPHSPEEVLFRWGTGGGQGWRGEAGRGSGASPKQQEVWLRGDLEGGRGGQGLKARERVGDQAEESFGGHGTQDPTQALTLS